MLGGARSAIDRLLPPPPDAVQNLLNEMQFERLRGQIPLLNVTLIFTVLAAMLAGSPTTPLWVRFGLPMAVIIFSTWRIWVWRARRNLKYSGAEAEKMVRHTSRLFMVIASISSFWGVYTWLSDLSDYRHYAPFFLAMGAFATSYCLSVARNASIGNLMIALVPTTIVMLFSGESMPAAAAFSMLVGMAFLIRMIMQQHNQLVDMLLLQRQMHDLARVDMLTGLLNRRALFEELSVAVGHAIPGKVPAVAILDLDDFKPVNDGYGHAVGDRLLQQVADRLQTVCGSLARIARLGGDEFAILTTRSDHTLSADILDAVDATLNLPFFVDDLQLRVGVSIGMAVWSEDHIDMHCLLADADKRLYAAKAEHGGHGIRRSNFRAALQS